MSGSGKTSLALDTLYAEGQRRYIESFSTYTRQFLEQLDKPAADSIEGIPPSIAVTRKNVSRSSRATVGSATQINEHLQLLFARIGDVICHRCGQKVSQDSAESATEKLAQLPDGTRLMVGFTSHRGQQRPADVWVADLVALGYRRIVLGIASWNLVPRQCTNLPSSIPSRLCFDRLVANSESTARLRDSLEAAQEAGRGTSLVWIDAREDILPPDLGERAEIEEQPWLRRQFSQFFRCETCKLDYPTPEPQLLNYNNPLGACPACEGFGNVIDIDMDRVVPDPSKSLARRCDRPLEYAGLRTRIAGTVGTGQRIQTASRRSVSRS